MWKPKLDLAALVRRTAPARPPVPGRLREIAGFGDNPGRLRMFMHVPPGLPAGAPLVVALHGCTQDAASYDLGTGLSRLADRAGFALVMGEQMPANNRHLCFNWFDPAHAARDRGEAASIAAMVRHALAVCAAHPARVFVTGLSAGGAMANAMLASYPDMFAGGGIIAGLPFGVAGSVPDAFAAMAGQRRLAAGDLADAVRRASPHRGPWPRVAIWQGDADPTVAAVNADDLAAQWQGVHGLDGVPPHIHARPDRQRARWCAADGSVLIESVRIAGLAHAVPLDLSGDPALRLGQPGRHFVDVGISAMRHIAAFWGLLPAEPELVRPVQPAAARPALGVQATIAAALRTAGLRP